MIENLKLAGLKACIVLIPSYSMAYFTEKMVWVVPTLVAAGFFAGTISVKEEIVKRQLEEDSDSSEDSDLESAKDAVADQFDDFDVEN